MEFSEETLVAACKEAGIDEGEAKDFINSREGAAEVKMAVREQQGNGIDAVPYIVVEGRRRDVTIQGCQELNDYLKAVEQVAKEC